jgi:hypothetical protein
VAVERYIEEVMATCYKVELIFVELKHREAMYFSRSAKYEEITKKAPEKVSRCLVMGSALTRKHSDHINYKDVKHEGYLLYLHY